ncbi:MAG: ActS/PrrB/RegB family redox-sensitive histidine kinase [Hyphomonadaceae bacterium]|nr:ActS/PrrB/RegB family redox-sensitive histidine kinase [Hyphomonadaceae bacterium]
MQLRTLVLLRWLAVAGQTAAVVYVRYGLGFDVPMAAALGVIAVSAWVNIFLMVARPSQGVVADWEAAAQLAYDVVQLAVLLALTGGVANPFLMLFIAPVAVSAIVLRPAVTVALAVLTYVCVGVIALWRLPLPWRPGESYAPPEIYQFGLAAAVLIGLGFTSVYAWRVAAEEERLSAALAEVQTVLAREQKLSALGGLAAAAAHELGTPLATIHLVAKEMERTLGKDPAFRDSPLLEDVQLLVSQSERCRSILKQLSSRKEEGDAVHARLTLETLLDDVCDRHRGLGAEIHLHVEPAADGSRAPELARSPEIIHGLGNIVENAVGFAAGTVDVAARWTADEIEIVVRDDGPGFPQSVLARLGEPYVSERAPGDAGGGLGLGFFIAKTLLERTGARVEARNRTPPKMGAVVRATWPRAAIEAPPLPLGTTNS